MSEAPALGPAERMLVEVVARELEALATAPAPAAAGPLVMAAALLRSLDAAGSVAPPAPDRSIDGDRLKRYLVGAGVVGPDARLSLQRSALGYSKDTYLVEVAEPSRTPQVVVIRRDLPAGPTRTRVVDEFPLLRACFAEGLPVAEPLLVEPDPAVLDRPFILTRGMAGRPDYLLWASDPAERRAIADQLASFLARLHTLPTETAPLPRLAPGGSPRDELAAYFRRWRELWRSVAPPGFELLDDAYAHVEAVLPELERVAVVHGDVGFHNALVQDGRLTAMLDWEFAHFGEPEEDLAYARKAIEALVGWDEFLAAYGAAGGPAVSPERIRAYEIWRGLRNATCCATGRQAFESGGNTDLRLAYAGRVLLRDYLADVADRLAASRAETPKK